MTKLMEWLFIGFFLLSSWIVIIKKNSEWYYNYFPVIIIFNIGIYSAFVILYRVFTFNNCEDAAIELQKQIKEATRDLKNKGIVFE